MSSLINFFLGLMLVLTSLFLILLVLIQRGRGGGLAGAFGGAGGQSAFGTKAGDVFTKITVGVATFWIVLCILALNILGRRQSLLSSNLGGAAPAATQAAPVDGTPAAAPDATLPAAPATGEPGSAAPAATAAPGSAAAPAAEAEPATPAP